MGNTTSADQLHELPEWAQVKFAELQSTINELESQLNYMYQQDIYRDDSLRQYEENQTFLADRNECLKTELFNARADIKRKDKQLDQFVKANTNYIQQIKELRYRHSVELKSRSKASDQNMETVRRLVAENEAYSDKIMELQDKLKQENILKTQAQKNDQMN